MNKNLKPVIAVAGLSLAFSVAFTGLVSCDKGGSGDDETTTNPSIYDTTADPAGTSDPTASSSGETTAGSLEFTEVNETVYVTVDQVTLRTEPKKSDSTYAGTRYFGNSLTRVKYNENWSVVLIGEEELYISSDCLSTTDPTKLTVEFNAIDKTVYVSYCDTLNLRILPDADSTIHASVPTSTALVAIGISTDNQWYKINYNNTIVYAKASFLIDHLLGSDFTEISKTVRVVGSQLSVRNYPTDEEGAYVAVAYVTTGTELKVIGVSPDGNWYKIKFTPAGGTEGTYYIKTGSTRVEDVVESSTTESSTTTEATGK